MIKKRYSFVLAFALICSLPQLLQSQSSYEYIHSPKTDIYFGHITYTEVEHDGNDPMVLREGEEAPRVAELNFPLLPGDTIRTTGSRRCEIQLDTGTIIRLDFNTELVIETIMAKSLSSFNKITNFLLNRGEIYIMYKRYNYPEIFQVITPNASTKLKHRTVALIAAREDGATDIQIKLGKAFVLYGPNEDSLMERILKKEMKLTITTSRGHQALEGEYKEDEDFILWNDSINKNFRELHDGLSVIPKPILRYPRAVVYFAQKYSTLYGEWIWDDMYGYVWRCDYNDYYPWGAWQPYYYGQWRAVDDQLFWVPMESWGWVPYHLGLWIWNKKRGWLWIPGSAFAPAWVSFHTWGDYCGWRPWSYWDWYLCGAYNRYPYFYLFNPQYPDSPLDPGWQDFIRKRGEEIFYTRISRQQLRKPASPYPLPREFKGTLKRIVSALERGDARILASIRENVNQTVVVKNGDLNETGIHKRAVVFHKLPLHMQKSLLPTETIENPNREAVRIYRNNENGIRQEKSVLTGPGGKINKEGDPPAEAARSITLNKKDGAEDESGSVASDSQERQARFVSAVPVIIPKLRPRRSIAHIRDWNPDAGVARQVGVSLKYSSRTNEIKCPELGMTSNSVRAHRNMATMAARSSVRSGGDYSGSGVSSSSRSSSSTSSRAVSSSSSRRSGGGGSSRGSGGGSSRGGGKKK